MGSFFTVLTTQRGRLNDLKGLAGNLIDYLMYLIWNQREPLIRCAVIDMSRDIPSKKGELFFIASVGLLVCGLLVHSNGFAMH